MGATESKAPNRENPNPWTAFLVLIGGSLMLGALMLLSRMVRIDSILVISNAIFNIFSGIKDIGLGVSQVFLGILQLAGLAAIAIAGILAVLAIANGCVRLGLKLLPQIEIVWLLGPDALNMISKLVRLPQRDLHKSRLANSRPKLVRTRMK